MKILWTSQNASVEGCSAIHSKYFPWFTRITLSTIHSDKTLNDSIYNILHDSLASHSSWFTRTKLFMIQSIILFTIHLKETLYDSLMWHSPPFIQIKLNPYNITLRTSLFRSSQYVSVVKLVDKSLLLLSSHDVVKCEVKPKYASVTRWLLY